MSPETFSTVNSDLSKLNNAFSLATPTACSRHSIHTVLDPNGDGNPEVYEHAHHDLQ